MFVQVVRGVVADPDAAFARLDHWLAYLAPGAPGWLGTTAGVTADRELVSFVRFATAGDARHSSDRVEQGQWWAESVLLFTGDVTFANFDDVTVFGQGGSDDAEAVEVVLGRVRTGSGSTDVADRLARQALEQDRAVIGGLVGVQDDGRFAQAVYLRGKRDRGPVRDPRAMLDGRAASADVRLLRLERLWLGSPERSAVVRG